MSWIICIHVHKVIHIVFPLSEMGRKTTSLGEELKVNYEKSFTHSGDSDVVCRLRVWVDVLIAAPLPKLFTYEWQDCHEPKFGSRVIVQFGRRKVVGLIYQVWQGVEPPQFKSKLVEVVLDNGDLLSDQWRHLIEFCSKYYHYPLGLIALEALPKALRVLNGKGLEPVMAKKAREHAEQLSHNIRVQNKTGVLEEPLALNREQADALHALKDVSCFVVHLLYGVTGSGKTEVYLNWIDHCLKQGGQALVLLPEINLTPAALSLYEKRLSHLRVVVLHSNLAELPRTRNWFAAASGAADVVIATRLGVLTPLPKLKLIVVDEEHDPSYRQQEGMKYNARDVAVVIAKQMNVPIVLGSATPSMESWLRARQGQYKLLEMKNRAVSGASLPAIELINTAHFKPVNGLSEPVITALKNCFALGKQSIVFLNRRGYAPQMACDACGWVAGCKSCSAHMVWHKKEGALRCHHCGAGRRVPSHCPECGNQDLIGFGRGTQKLEEVLEGLLPEARILRIDADSTRNKGQIEHLLKQAHEGDAHVLVGTQMISKGHDFQNIGLVIALNVDSSLFSHSYKAPERLFSQLMQVAGRAGRREGEAKMLVQTLYPHHPLFEALIKHDFRQFAKFELQTRQEARMPPFTFQALLRADHKYLANCIDFLRKAREQAQDLLTELVYVCDPVPLQVVRVADTERAQMLIESDSRPELHRFLDRWLAVLYGQKTSVRWYLEVDPIEL